MESLESELETARDLDPEALADAIESIGFECTDCGACCRSEGDDEHVATAFPDEIRRLRDATDADWRDVARPTPFGLREGPDGPEGETFEWALQTDGCGDCAFFDGDADGGGCTVYGDRPLICRTYPFSLALGGTSQPLGEAVEDAGMVRAHECEGLGTDIDREAAVDLARTLKRRAIRELEEAIAVRDAYRPVAVDRGQVVVHDSEGAKRSDGSSLEE